VSPSTVALISTLWTIGKVMIAFDCANELLKELIREFAVSDETK
jgi:hypothetical protein